MDFPKIENTVLNLLLVPAKIILELQIWIFLTPRPDG